MRNSKIALAAVMLCTLSFGAFAAAPAPQPGNNDHTQVGNIAPGSQSTGQSMNDAFDVHKLVAGEWS